MNKKKSTSVTFNDLEGNHLSIHWNNEFKRFSVGITDAYGNRTNSIEMGYEDLRSLFKESEEIFFQHLGEQGLERNFPKPNVEE